MKAVWNGVVVAESDDTVVVEGNHYFPESSLKREFTSFSNHRSHCHWKGEAHYYSLFVNGEMNPDAVWYYPEPSPGRQADQGPRGLLEGCEGGVNGLLRPAGRPESPPPPGRSPVAVHDERPVLRDRLVQRLAGDQDRARAVGAGLQHARRRCPACWPGWPCAGAAPAAPAMLNSPR